MDVALKFLKGYHQFEVHAQKINACHLSKKALNLEMDWHQKAERLKKRRNCLEDPRYERAGSAYRPLRVIL